MTGVAPNQEPGNVMFLSHQQMYQLPVLALLLTKLVVLRGLVVGTQKLMEDGEVGHLGHPVEVTI